MKSDTTSIVITPAQARESINLGESTANVRTVTSFSQLTKKHTALILAIMRSRTGTTLGDG
jgi:hypothetical protein